MTNCYFQSNTHILEQSQSKTPIGNLLSDLEPEMRQKVLDEPCMRRPLIMAEGICARMIQEKLMDCSYFDADQGRFIRTKRCSRGRTRLGPMGYILTIGYVQIQIKGFKFVQSHLVYLWFTGDFPDSNKEMDHIDGNRLNDRPDNLRLVSPALNARNHKMHKDNTTGYTGVYYMPVREKVNLKPFYQASVKVKGNNKHLGCFATAKQASIARQTWLDNHPELGYTARHGK